MVKYSVWKNLKNAEYRKNLNVWVSHEFTVKIKENRINTSEGNWIIVFAYISTEGEASNIMDTQELYLYWFWNEIV